MATRSGYPSWLLDSKEHISKTKEWNSMVAELHEAIQQQLTESHVQNFTDLSDAEKTLFMERATLALHGSQAYESLYSKVSLSLDQHVNNKVAQELLEDFPTDTKTDLILQNVEEGSVSVLRKWPEMKSKLHICLNQSLPVTLRQVAWRLFLNNTKVRKEYVDVLSTNPRSAISPLDLEISQKCEHLLNTQPTLQEIRGSVGAFYAMKAVLSYHHARKQTRSSLLDMDFLLVVPFVFVASKVISRREPPSSQVIAMLVEEYLCFMESRPGYMVDSGSEIHNEEMKGFAEKIAQILESKSPELAKKLVDIYVPTKENRIVTTDAGKHQVLVETIIGLVRPVVKSLFVGYLNIPTLLYVWDQYIIGLDVPGYHTDCLPVFTAVFLITLKDELLKQNQPNEIEDVIRTNSIHLTVKQFQYEVNRHFYRELSAILIKDDKTGLPVLDPTQVKHPPWSHWGNEMIPHKTTAEDRKLARQEREEERQRLIQLQREAEEREREEEERRRRQADRDMKKQFASDRRKGEDEKSQLERMLAEERRKREEAERKAETEIEKLKKEIEELKTRRGKSPAPSSYTLQSVASRFLIPPPPTRASRAAESRQSTHVINRTPTPRVSREEQVRGVVKTLLGRVQEAMFKIGQGSAWEVEQLDKESKESIKKSKEDFKFAEREVFGRQLRPGEFDALPDDQKQVAGERMTEIIRNRIRDRQARADMASQGSF